MEDDKKKKRNKKKKNKSSKPSEDAVVGGGETGFSDQNHVSNGRNVQNGNVQDIEGNMNGHNQLNAIECSHLAEAEKQKSLPEGTLEETIKQLRDENDSYTQKEVALEETIKQLQDENGSHIQKEVALEEKIIELQTENDSHLEKEVVLEETIMLLKNENASHIRKEAILEGTIIELRNENDLLIQKENAAKETIAGQNDDITRLKMQVVELEESKTNLSQENQQLMENVSHLQLQLRNLDSSISSSESPNELGKGASEQEDLSSQIEAACALVEKLVTENAELVEKVNELSVKLDQQSMSARLSLASGNDEVLGSVDVARAADDMSEDMSVLGQKLESLEDVPIEVKIDLDHKTMEPAAVISDSSEAGSGEIVQIPLDDNEIRDVESQFVLRDKEAPAVPLSDAPLIGAPFRLVSFVARYVSGADLVDKNSGNSGL